MAQHLTSLCLQPLSSRVHPPRLLKSPLISTHLSPSILRHCRRPAQTPGPMSLSRGSGAAARASPSKQAEGKAVQVGDAGSEWGKASAVLFDMDGVLCNSEELSRLAAVDVFAEMGVSVTTDDFIPFMGTGEANFLGGVARVKGVEGFNPEDAKKQFFRIYLDKYAKPDSGIGFPGALELIMECKKRGLKVAVASSADRIKVDANLAAAGIPISLFDAIVSADVFENLKPAPDIFLAASKNLKVPESESFSCKEPFCDAEATKWRGYKVELKVNQRLQTGSLCPNSLYVPLDTKTPVLLSIIPCIVIEDALAGVQAAKAAQMRCIAVTTTLSEEKLQQANPSLIRKEIGNISINDVLYGGHSTDQSI